MRVKGTRGIDWDCPSRLGLVIFLNMVHISWFLCLWEVGVWGRAVAAPRDFNPSLDILTSFNNFILDLKVK